MELKGTYSASNFFIKKGIKIDLLRGYYQISTKLLSFLSLPTKWIKIPSPNYVLVFKTLYAKCEACEIEDFENGDGSVYQLSIVHHKVKRLIIDEGKNKDAIFNKAKLLAAYYNVRIKDSATNRRQPFWI